MISPFNSVIQRLEMSIQQRLKHLPVVSFYGKTRGWPFVVTWVHRITGILLVLYVWFHIYTLSFLKFPEIFDAKMKFFRFFLFVFLEWLLAVPVIFHALNGGRLILYESFSNRENESMIRWVLSLSVIYVSFLGVMMIMGNQTISPVFFWALMLIVSIILGYLVGSRIWNTGNSVAWRLQRMTGVFLFTMIPAHMMFMHLAPAFGHESAVIIKRMRNGFIKFVDLSIIVAVLFHGGYGLVSIAKDYLTSRNHLYGVISCVAVVIVVFGWLGIRLIFLV